MNNIKLIISIFFLLLAFSCTKDSCQNVICLNGGTCNDGTCQCTPGYSGEHCDIYDLCFNVNCPSGMHCEFGECVCPPGMTGVNCQQSVACANITCLNGGNCQNGICICPPGWTGINCQIPVSPVKVQVAKIEVLKFPALRPMMGASWDPDPVPNDKPDIFPVIQQDSLLPPLWSSPSVVNNAITGNVYVFTNGLPFDLLQPALPYVIRLMDSDAPSAPESMGKITFMPYVPGNGFPQQIVLDPGGSLAFRLTLNYIW